MGDEINGQDWAERVVEVKANGLGAKGATGLDRILFLDYGFVV